MLVLMPVVVRSLGTGVDVRGDEVTWYWCCCQIVVRSLGVDVRGGGGASPVDVGGGGCHLMLMSGVMGSLHVDVGGGEVTC